MNPIAVFLTVFFLGCIAWATLGLEVAVADPDLAKNLTFATILGLSLFLAMFAFIGEFFEWPKMNLRSFFFEEKQDELA